VNEPPTYRVVAQCLDKFEHSAPNFKEKKIEFPVLIQARVIENRRGIGGLAPYIFNLCALGGRIKIHAPSPLPPTKGTIYQICVGFVDPKIGLHIM
jgi:hypothetical protein